ncbi:hypothetical protein CYLTODRAFT_438434 [Cylindrobasidium torrendii FP15055 ss-10]|uniref:Vacuolar protein sorting-associated protein 62 n=1 Tax=Cylindrobasidium torrendii FP15055 ss-10 TaxID=1314674 RepID=A0A0D7B2K9_9AGAR|nr:hypothetical protein CYLTODRAFT_438434 [Cylindrobasidium torrendii FP15055 ss-10]
MSCIVPSPAPIPIQVPGLFEEQMLFRDTSSTLAAVTGFGLAGSCAAAMLEVPDYVLKYAPMAYLYSGEAHFPSDVAEHVAHTYPAIDFGSVGDSPTLPTLNDISVDAFLTSLNDPTERPPASWLTSTANKPDQDGKSAAPATIILVKKEGGILDAFYMYFYSFNYGPSLLDVRFGHHVGDWEHSMVRFINGQPTYIYLSQHDGGSSYTFDALTKDPSSSRPKVYIASGSHATYATPGKHGIEGVPLGLVNDFTDEGTLWDVTKNYRAYWYDGETFSVGSGEGSKADAEEKGSEWLQWSGRWGDEQYPDTDKRQYDFLGFRHYVTGPAGPIAKNLTRVEVCAIPPCEIFDSADAVSGAGEETEMDPEQLAQIVAAFQSFKAGLVEQGCDIS